MPLPKPNRLPWDKFPDVVIIAGESAVKKHPEYPQAKAGNVNDAATAAKRLAADFAFAELLAERLGLQVETSIVQANIVNHTGASGWARIARPPIFAGDVVAERNYLLVDDFVGQGGTLANLRGYIMHEGGLVCGAVTLTGQAYSAKLALEAQTLEALRAKHGQEIEKWWLKSCGYGFERLTESEARYLIRAEDAHTIRAKLAEAGFAGHD